MPVLVRSMSVADVSAFRDGMRNLIADDGDVPPARVAAITASGLRLIRVQPLLGRALLDRRAMGIVFMTPIAPERP